MNFETSIQSLKSEGDDPSQRSKGKENNDKGILLPRSTVPAFESYSIRDDDDEITSSDEESKEITDSSLKSWFFRSRHQKPPTANTSLVKLGAVSTTESAIAEGTPHNSRSASPFRKSLRSFFRRDSAHSESDADDTPLERSDACGGGGGDNNSHGTRKTETSDNAGSDHGSDGDSEVEDEEKEQEVEEQEADLPETPTNNKFWRSWRSGHHHGPFHNRLAGPRLSGETEDLDVGTLRKLNPHDKAMLSHEQKRQKNMAKLADQLMDVSPLHGTSTDVRETEKIFVSKETNFEAGSFESNSSSSSIERALIVKDRVASVFSASPQDKAERKDEVSPLTPLEDMIENPYKYVFEPAKESTAAPLVQDCTSLDRDSIAFKNLTAALTLLTKNVKAPAENSSFRTLTEISIELLDFIKHDVDCREHLTKEKLAMENTLKTSEEKLATLRAECQNKDDQNSKLEKEIQEAKMQIGTLGHDLEEAFDEIELLSGEVEAYKKKIEEVQIHEKVAVEEFENRIEEMQKSMELRTEHLNEVTKDNSSLKSRIETLQKDYKNLVFDHEVLQEKHSITTTRLSDLVGSINNDQAHERDMRDSLEATGNKLRRFENTIEILKIGNLKIQENFHRERRKVLDLREENNVLKKQAQLVECHRTQSLQFMSHLMFYYRGIVSDDTLTQFDFYLKKMNESDYSTIAQLKDEEIKARFKEREALVIKFYNEIARKQFLDQVVAKHVSYMRSNNFLSGQLSGLRKHISDYEQYVSRLLREIRDQTELQGKDKQTIALLREKNAEYKTKLSEIAK